MTQFGRLLQTMRYELRADTLFPITGMHHHRRQCQAFVARVAIGNNDL
jgi:hypothetical protein